MASINLTISGATALIARFGGKLDLAGSVVVGTNVNYARYVHDGTSRMVGRPYLTNALTSQRARVVSMLEARVVELLKGSGGSIKPALLAAGLVVQAEAQRNTPVRTGNLRRSLHTEAM